jgi:hypothetical protein
MAKLKTFFTLFLSLLLNVGFCQHSFVSQYTDNALNPSAHQYSSAQTADENFIIVATGTNPFLNEKNLFIIKMNSIGDTLWSKYYDFSYQIPRTVLTTRDTGFIIGGDNFILKARLMAGLNGLRLLIKR